MGTKIPRIPSVTKLDWSLNELQVLGNVQFQNYDMNSSNLLCETNIIALANGEFLRFLHHLCGHPLREGEILFFQFLTDGQINAAESSSSFCADKLHG